MAVKETLSKSDVLCFSNLKISRHQIIYSKKLQNSKIKFFFKLMKLHTKDRKLIPKGRVEVPKCDTYCGFVGLEGAYKKINDVCLIEIGLGNHKIGFVFFLILHDYNINS